MRRGRWCGAACIGRFVAGTVAIQAALARHSWSMARGGLLPPAPFFTRVPSRDALPINVIVVSAAVASLFHVAAFEAGPSKTLVIISTIGFVSVSSSPQAVHFARMRGRWISGPFSLGLGVCR